MRNFASKNVLFLNLLLVILFFLIVIPSITQVCGTPGVDGPVSVSSVVNTYYPISGDVTLNVGIQAISLVVVFSPDGKANSFGTIPIDS
jgi:hypothetical protein